MDLNVQRKLSAVVSRAKKIWRPIVPVALEALTDHSLGQRWSKNSGTQQLSGKLGLMLYMEMTPRKKLLLKSAAAEADMNRYEAKARNASSKHGKIPPKH